MNLVFFGPPGAGKGTIAARLAADRNIPHISTGELFREAAKHATNLGKKIKTTIDSGILVPDEITIELVRKRLSRPDASTGFILDGFPRTVSQAEALGDMVDIAAVLNLSIDDETAANRLTGRRTCTNCGLNHHVIFMPPKIRNKCDSCGGDLVRREDDSDTAIATRLKVYKSQSEPLIEYYTKKNVLINIDASPETETIYGMVLNLVAG